MQWPQAPNFLNCCWSLNCSCRGDSAVCWPFSQWKPWTGRFGQLMHERWNSIYNAFKCQQLLFCRTRITCVWGALPDLLALDPFSDYLSLLSTPLHCSALWLRGRSLAGQAVCAPPHLLCVLAGAAPTSLFRSCVKHHLLHERFPEISLLVSKHLHLSLCLSYIMRIFAMISAIHTVSCIYVCLLLQCCKILESRRTFYWFLSPLHTAGHITGTQ